jgi:EAL domain-containing protein (putative c-di-GMP-specific phosphodiesterase class I)
MVIIMNSQMVLDISHELRTPLTVIQVALDILSCGQLGTLSQQEQRMVEIAVKNTERLIRLTTAIEGQPEAQTSFISAEKLALLRLEEDLRKALIHNQLELYYQPIINLKDDKLLGFEALVRWNHPSLGMIFPDKFIPLAEESDLIIDIGKWILQEVCHQIQIWQQQSPEYFESLTFSANLSSKQLTQTDLAAQIKEILDGTGVQSHNLVLEITETALVDQEITANATLSQLKNLGIKLYIDDFGTGYSSLNRLYDMPFDVLKIDRSFVQKLGTPSGKYIVQTITKLAEHLGMDVVAEGVETIEQLNELKSLDCYRGQGYLFAKPLAANTVPNFVFNNSAVDKNADSL